MLWLNLVVASTMLGLWYLYLQHDLQVRDGYLAASRDDDRFPLVNLTAAIERSYGQRLILVQLWRLWGLSPQANSMRVRSFGRSEVRVLLCAGPRLESLLSRAAKRLPLVSFHASGRSSCLYANL